MPRATRNNMNITPPSYARKLAHTVPALGRAPEPFGVLASVEGWKYRFWVHAGYGHLPVSELIDLIVKEFGRRVHVWLDVPLEDCTLHDSRRAPINPSRRIIDVLENNSSVILTF